MIVDFMTLAYDGNYVGKTLLGKFFLFTYKGELWATDPDTDAVVLL